MRVTNEQAERWATVNTDDIKTGTIQDICFSTAFIIAKEMATDLLDSRAIIEKQTELIKEMRSKLLVGGIQATEDMTMYRSIPVDVEIIRDLIKRTKEYAE